MIMCRNKGFPCFFCPGFSVGVFTKNVYQGFVLMNTGTTYFDLAFALALYHQGS